MNNRRIPVAQSARLASPVPADSRYRYARRHLRRLFGLLDSMAGPLFQAATRPRPTPADSPRAILIVQLDHIGDAVLSTPMIRSIHEAFPDSTIDVVASRSNEPIFRTNPHVRRVHLSARNWLERSAGRQSYLAESFRLARLLRRTPYDWGIDPRGDFLAALTMWLAGIPRRVGWSCGGGGFLHTDLAEWDPSRHELDARTALLGCLGIEPASGRPELFPSWADRYSVRELRATLPSRPGPLAVVHIQAGTPAKRWPIQHFAQLARQLVATECTAVVLVGDSGEQASSRQLARTIPNVFDWTGHLTLLQLAALLNEADLFVGADSGPAHIAAAMGTPSVVLFSGTNRVECWQPRGAPVRVVRAAVPCAPCHLKSCPVDGHPCMTRIQPDEVLDAVRSVLSERPGPARPATGQVPRTPRRDSIRDNAI